MSGKRANIFSQGRPEQPYDEREESDAPQKATAAQMAARKIKTAKPRRAAGASATPSIGTGFGAPTGGMTFGASAPAVGGNNSNGMGFGGNNAFGGATSSFPPAQSSAPSNSFANSSFPAFGASSQSTGFNPQPPTANFNFTAGNSNPFGSLSAPATNGSTPAPVFGGGSGNPFGGLSQGNTASATGNGGLLFSTSSAPPQTNMFGTTSSVSNSSSTPTSAATPFAFGSTASTAPPATSAPAPSSMFSGFGTAPQTSTQTAPSSMFSGFGSNAQKNSEPAQQETQKSPFTMGTNAQAAVSATTTAPSPSLFSFGSNTPKSDTATSAAPATNMFEASTPSSAPATNPFAKLPTASTTPAPFSFGQQTPQTQDKPAATTNNLFSSIKIPEPNSDSPKPSLFSSIKAPGQGTSAPAETPKPNLFSSLPKPPQSASTPGFNMFGAQKKDEPSATTTSQAAKSDKPTMFGGFSTPQPTKTSEVEKSQAGLFTAQPKPSSGLFSQDFQPEKHNSNNAFTAPSSSMFKPQSTSSNAATSNGTAQSSAQPASNPFASLPAPSTERPNLFAPAQQPAPSLAAAPASSFTSNTSSATASAGLDLPKVPKAHVPKEWTLPAVPEARDADGLFNLISSLVVQLQQLNGKYRAKLNNLSPAADWSAISQWHYQHSSAIRKRIDIAKKERATAKGVTGTESALSTKRKVDNESSGDGNASPSKRARPADVGASPTPQPSASASRSMPPATATSNLFAKAINNKPSTPADTNNGGFKPAVAPTAEPSKPAASFTGFKPSFPASNGTSSSPSLFSASAGGFKPSTASTGSAGGFKPTVTGGSGGFASQFASSAKTYEQLAAERKKKAKDADYDSDDETEEEWSARYDKKEAERIAKEKAEAAAVSGFSLTASGKTSGTATPSSNLFAKPASGASTPVNGLFAPRPASPALSSAGQSVFENASTAQAPSPNIFGHLSSGPSSNNNDDSDDDADQVTGASPNDQPIGSVGSITPPKRKFGDSATEADDSSEEAATRKKQDTAPKGSLLSRMTRPDEDGSESEKENNNGSIFGKANGTQTPTNKPFNFFDFGAAGANTAPPKSDTTFAGDQTFKPGTPIKFGIAPATEQKAPTFQFQPASTSTTPSKPPPSTIFNFGTTSSGSGLLTPNAGLSGLGSAPSSRFSSRAATPLSEADNSAASAAEDEEEGGKQEQVDLSKLTAEEKASNDVIFETEQALAKHQVDKGDGTKAWESFARGPLYILKDKVTGKCFVRIRIPSGQTPLNYSILPALKATVTGSSGKMVLALMPKKEGGFSQVFISVKTPEIATEFATKYNDSLPS